MKLILSLAVVVAVDRKLDACVGTSVAEGERFKIFHVFLLGGTIVPQVFQGYTPSSDRLNPRKS